MPDEENGKNEKMGSDPVAQTPLLLANLILTLSDCGAAHSLLNDFSANHQSAPCLQENEGQMFATVVDYASFSTLCKSLFKWAAECYPLQNNAGASARTAMLLLFQALGGDTLRMAISLADMVIGFWQLLFGVICLIN